MLERAFQSLAALRGSRMRFPMLSRLWNESCAMIAESGRKAVSECLCNLGKSRTKLLLYASIKLPSKTIQHIRNKFKNNASVCSSP